MYNYYFLEFFCLFVAFVYQYSLSFSQKDKAQAARYQVLGASLL